MTGKEKLDAIRAKNDPQFAASLLTAKASMKMAMDKVGTLKGYSPVKGLDYFTQEEQDEMIAYIKSQVQDGHTPTEEELLSLITPLIPEVEPPTEEELLVLIKPLIPEVKDGVTPSKKELLSLIVPLIPEPIKPTPPSKQELVDIIKPLIPEPPKADDIIKQVQEDIKKYNTENKFVSQNDISSLIAHLKSGGFRGGGMSSVVHDSTLTGLGTSASPLSAVSTAPGGTPRQIQYNNSGVFGGFGNYDKGSNLVTLSKLEINTATPGYFSVINLSTAISQIYADENNDLYFGDYTNSSSGTYFKFTNSFYFDFFLDTTPNRFFELDLASLGFITGDVDGAYSGYVMGLDTYGGYGNGGTFFIGAATSAGSLGIANINASYTISLSSGEITLYGSATPASGQTLIGDGSNLKLAPLFDVKTKTANYTLSATADEMIICTTNSFDVTFPTAVGFIRSFTVKNMGSGKTITLKTTSSQTIDTNASGTLTLLYKDSITVRSDGSNWVII